MVRFGLFVCVLVGAGVVVVACSSETSSSGSGAGGTASTSSSTSRSASSSTGVPDSGPVTCPTQSYTNIPKGACDLLAQDCNIGETCAPNFDGMSTQCDVASGLKGPGENCDTPDECRAGLFCIGPAGQSQCTMVCCPETNAPCGGGTCNVEVAFASGTSPPIAEMCAFSEQCQLLTANACDPGYDCHVEDASQGLATCNSPSSQVTDELGSCTYLNDCHDMQDCFRVAGQATGTCYWYCFLDLQQPASPGLGGCPAGETCVDTVDNAGVDFGIPNIGLCHP